jgi:hypothetical protein
MQIGMKQRECIITLDCGIIENTTYKQLKQVNLWEIYCHS